MTTTAPGRQNRSARHLGRHVVGMLGNPPIGKLLNGFRSRRSTIRSAIPKGRGGIVWSTMHFHKFRNLSAISDLKTSIDNNCLSSNIA